MRNLTCVLLCFCLCLGLSGCKTESPSQPNTTVAAPPVLSVYYLTTDPEAKGIVDNYKSSYPDVALTATGFDSVKKLDAQIQKDLAEDTGPDVVIFPNGTTIDPVKLALDDAFLDIGPMLTEDSTFQTENYYAVLNAGKVAGKQVMMPLRMQIPHLTVTEERLRSYNIPISENYTAAELMQMLIDHAKECDEQNSAFTVAHSDTNLTGYLYDILRLTGYPVVEVTDQAAQLQNGFGERQLRQYADFMKTFAEQYTKTTEILKTNSTPAKYLPYITARLSDLCLPQSMRHGQTLYQACGNETMRLFVYPNEENGLTADVSLYVAALSSTKQPQTAYQFIRHAMDYNTGTITNDLSVNKKTVEQQLRAMSLLPGRNIDTGNGMVQIPKLSKELQAECEAILNRITGGSIPSNPLRTIIGDAMRSYILGEVDYETSYQNLQEQLQIYVKNERSNNP